MFALPAAASAIAAAAPAAAAGAASAGIGATLTSIAGNVLMNVAISAAMSIFQPQVGVAGRTFEWTLDPDGPIPFAAGRIGVPGSAVYRKTFGPDLMYYGIPSVLSGAGPIDGYEAFLADDESVTFDGSGKAVSSQYAGELWYKTKLGTQPDTAITSPTGLKNNVTLPGWTSAHKLSGKASYMIVMGENSKGSAFPTGEIKPLITLRGLKVYDPRLDSTYPGGSGAHRLANPATWTYSTNPVLWALKWTLGLWEGPNGKGAPQVDYQVGGIGAKLSGIDVPAFVAAANVADANGWTCAAYPTTDDDKYQVLTGFLQAGGAIYAQRAGKISCIQRAAPRTSIVTISAYDTAGPLEIDTAASRIDRINTLRPRFWSEPHRWQMTALDQEVTAQAYRDDDGAVRTRGIDYPYVTNARQAGQLAALQIANTREGIAGVIPLKPHLQRIRPGDAFTITEAGFVLNGLKCLCLNTDYDPATGVVRVSFVSETDAKYPFALGQNPTPPTPQVLTPVDPRFVSPPGAGDWTITPRPPAPGGGQLPGFDLSGIVSNATATAIIVEYGLSATGPWMQAYQGPPTVTNIPLDGLQPGVQYWVAIQYQRNQNYSERHVYGPYLAPDLVAGDVSPTAPVIVAMQDAIDLTEAGVGAINTAVASLNATIHTAGTGLQAQTASLLASLNTPTTGVLARLTATEGQVSTNNSAAVDRLNALEATVNTTGTGLAARLATAESAIVTNRDAAAQRLSALEATVNTSGTGLSAKVAGLQSAVTSLTEGKANASDLTLLQTEVTTARGGASSLNFRLNTVESNVAGKASATRVEALETAVSTPGTGLAARIGAAEQAIATETTARAEAVSQLLARQNINRNLLPGGSGERGVAGWDAPVGLTVVDSPANGGSVFYKNYTGAGTVDHLHISPKVAIGEATFVTLSFKGGSQGFTGGVRLGYLGFYNDAGGYVGESATRPLTGGDVTAAKPSGATRAAFVAKVSGVASSSYAEAFFRQIKIEPGQVATIYSNDALDQYLSSSVGDLRQATIDLAAGKADATRVTSLEASVNTPGTGISARLTNVESVAASADGRSKAIKGVVLDVNNYISGYSSTNDGTTASFEILTDVFALRAPGSGERMEMRSGNTFIYSPADSSRTRYGKAFGGDQKLVWWTGPSSVTEGSETKGNAYVYMSQNTVGGPRFGGSDVLGPGGTLTATASTGFIGGARNGAGYVATSNQVTVTVSGGTAGAVIRWSLISGDSRIRMNDPTAFNTGAYATIGIGESITAYFMGAVTKGGQSAVVYVQADLGDNGT